MAIEEDGMRKRVERLRGLAAGLEKELEACLGRRGDLSCAEHQDYLKGVREAADGAAKGAQVLAEALRRIAAKAA